MERQPRLLLSAQDLHRIHIEILRQLTGHEPPTPAATSGGPRPQPRAAADLLALVLAAR